MNDPIDLLENIYGGLDALHDLNSARNAYELVVSAEQAIAYLSAIAISPATAGLAIRANGMAAAGTLGKILSDHRTYGRIDFMDLAAIAGNIAVITAAVAINISPAGKAMQLAIAIGRGVGILGFASKLHGEAHAADMSATYLAANAARPPRRDPLAIDLDRDGIETRGISASPITFDHNADGVRTGTGWLTGDDAWLVLDRNANGRIDTGRELFGVDTLKADGTLAGRRAVVAPAGGSAPPDRPAPAPRGSPRGCARPGGCPAR